MAVARPAISTMLLTTYCEAEEVHKKGTSSVRSMFAREIAASMAARAGDSPSLRRARHAQTIERKT
jgi:hypothetical protein